jgi:hypothetical protein
MRTIELRICSSNVDYSTADAHIKTDFGMLDRKIMETSEDCFMGFLDWQSELC